MAGGWTRRSSEVPSSLSRSVIPRSASCLFRTNLWLVLAELNKSLKAVIIFNSVLTLYFFIIIVVCTTHALNFFGLMTKEIIIIIQIKSIIMLLNIPLPKHLEKI